MKRSLLILVLGGIILLSLTMIGCGGSSDKKSSSSSVSSSSVSSSSSETSSSSSVASNSWTLVWSDEFDGNAIDPANWDHEVNCWGGGNDEQQCYTDRPDNSFVANGVLTILAQREDFTGPDLPDGAGDGTATLPYISARLRTKNLQEWTFGRFEIRAEYTLPDNANPADDFHVYAMEWDEDEIRWYVDDVHFATQRSSGWYSQYLVDGVLTDAPVGAPFDVASEYHLLLNLAVGGNWAGSVNDESIFPQTLQVDYVRVYQCSGSPVTGAGCATVGEDPTIVEGNPRPDIDADVFAPLPVFTIYENSPAPGLQAQSYNPNGHITWSEVVDAERGNVFNVVKTDFAGQCLF